jgi:hypothetical protein
VRTPSRRRGLVSTGTSDFCVVVMLVIGTRIGTAQRPAGRGNPRPGAAAPPAPSTPPQMSAVAIRVVGPGLGANGTELRPFNESPGTVVVLAIQPPRSSGIVGIDDDESRLEAFSDDKGQSLLEEGRVGPFPKVAEDGSVGIAEVEVRARPSAGATSVTVRGTLAVTLAAGSKPVRVAAVRLEPNQTFKVAGTTMTINAAEAQEEATKITLGLPRSMLNTIREVRFFDAKNAAIEGRRTGSGYFNEKGNLELEAKTKDKTVTFEFELWQNPRVVKVPFNVEASLGVASGGRTSGTGEAPAPGTNSNSNASEKQSPARPAGPPPVISATDGAASVEAVVKQMQTAAASGKAAQVLSVIYPTDRATYGQGVAMVLAFLPMASMDDPKAGEQVQKELDAFFEKHQLKPPFARDAEDLFKGIDVAAFVTDAFAFMKSHAKKGDKPGDALPVPSGRPENVKITGDTAVATLGGKDVKFTKISDRWFIRLE